MIFDIPRAEAALNAFSAPTARPERAETTIIAVSAALMPSAAPSAKSKRPGVSIIFIFVFLYSTGATAHETDILRFFSSAS